MKRKIIAVGLAVLLTAGLPLPRAGGEEMTPDGGGRPGRGFILPLIREVVKLNLTGDQKNEIRSACRKYWPEIKPLLKELNELRREIHAIINSEPLDEEAVREVIVARAGIAAELTVLRGKIGAEVRGLLTAEQVARLGAIRERVEGRIESLPLRIEKFLMGENS